MADLPLSTPPYRHRQGAGTALLLIGIALAISVVSFDPTTEPEHHPFGSPGYWLAQQLFDAWGFALYVICAGWCIGAISLLAWNDFTHWLTRMVGWTLLVPCSAIFADQLRGFISGPTATGPGGLVGAGLSYALIHHFAVVPRVAIFTACTSLALYLAMDTFLVSLAKVVLWVLWRLIRTLTRLCPRRAKRIDKRATASPSGCCRAEVDISIPSKGMISVPEPLTSTLSSDGGYELPPLNLLDDPEPFPHELHQSQLRQTAELLERTFSDLGLNVRVVGIHTGPVVTQFEIALETGLRVNKVTVLSDDLALNLKVPSVRIVAPIPGKNTVGIEVPNEHRAIVRLKELVHAAAAKINKSRLPLLLGKDTEGRPLVYDLAEMPHLLIAGRTGTGKSVCLNSIILSLLLTKRPDECRLIMIDPKQVEFSDYTRLPHLMCPVVTQNARAEAILAWAVDTMEERYSLLARTRCRNIAQFNSLTTEERMARLGSSDSNGKNSQTMPYIVIIIDEIGDLIMEMKKEVETHIIRLAQKSRAAGIHLILATQRPTVDVVTGLIKSNLPARICFQVSSRSDSRVVLDEIGADKLLGKGDMLFLQPGTSTLIRAQGAYASDQEIQRVVGYLECEPEFAPELMSLKSRPRDGSAGQTMKARDPLYEQAVEIIVRERRGSVSLLQRALGIGYGKAARFIDYMAEDGIVGHYNGSQAREVLITLEQWEEMRSAERV
jgi:DNA segregation ATPase FtsK/SpoIIIE-like protein